MLRQYVAFWSFNVCSSLRPGLYLSLLFLRYDCLSTAVITLAQAILSSRVVCLCRRLRRRCRRLDSTSFSTLFPSLRLDVSSSSSSSSCRAWLRNPTGRALRHFVFVVVVVRRRLCRRLKALTTQLLPRLTRTNRKVLFQLAATRVTEEGGSRLCRRRLSSTTGLSGSTRNTYSTVHHCHRCALHAPSSSSVPAVVVWSSSLLSAQNVGDSECHELSWRRGPRELRLHDTHAVAFISRLDTCQCCLSCLCGFSDGSILT